MNQKIIFARQMRTYSTLFLYFLLALISISCEQKCDEPDIERINSIYIQLKQGGSDGFSASELDSIYFVRYVPGSNPIIADTAYPDGYFPEGEGKFLINDTYPFINEEPPYWVVFGYEIVEPSSDFSTKIEGIDLKGMYDGDCGYNNVKKTFLVDSQEVDMSGSQEFYLITR